MVRRRRDLPGHLVTRPEAADLLKVSVRTVDRWCETGKLTRVDVLNTTGVVRVDIDRLMAEGVDDGAA